MANLQCIKCQTYNNKVVDSRGVFKAVAGREAVRRRRQCLKCGHRFSTLEIHEETLDIVRADHANVVLSKIAALTRDWEHKDEGVV